MGRDKEAFAGQFLRIIDKLILIDKSTILAYGKGLTLYPSEIHLILLIGNGQAGSFGSIVKMLGVTKGAVSQTVSRLVKKGVLEKRKDPEKGNDLAVLFTPLGEKVHQRCKKLQAALYRKLSSYFVSLPDKDREVIEHFLAHVETNLSMVNRMKSLPRPVRNQGPSRG